MQAFENVTGKNNPELIRAASLKDKKYRRKYGAFLADGIKLFMELCESDIEICNVWINENAKDRILPKIEELLKKRGNISVRIAAPSAFLKLTDEEACEGIVCEAKFSPRHTHAELYSPEEDERVLMLASLRDPGNLGAIVRSAAAFVVSPNYNVVTVNGRTFKDVAMFVAKRLSPLPGVLGTATHFVLKKYKERGVLFTEEEQDERGNI